MPSFISNIWVNNKYGWKLLTKLEFMNSIKLFPVEIFLDTKPKN
jgi:hypothetical protein